jgi:hypothetical protein
VSAWQLRRSKSLLGGLVRLTLGRSGVSTSIGVRGLRVSRSPKGRITRTVSVPGTGLFRRDRLR